MHRKHLPDRAPITRQKVRIGKYGVYIDIVFYDQEKTEIGGLFIIVDRNGSTERFLLESLAHMTSVAVQYGAPLENLMDQWIFTKGLIHGPVRGDSRVKSAMSVLDYCARHILVHYFGRDELAHVKEQTEE